MNMVAAFLGIYVIVMAVICLLVLASYLLKAFGIYGIAKNRNMPNPWLAFIPYANLYLQGKLAGTINFKKKKIDAALWMVIVPLVIEVLTVVFLVFYFIAIAAGVSMSYRSSFSTPPVSMIMSIVVICLLYILVVSIVQIALYVLYVFVNKKIFSMYAEPNMALLHSILSLFVPFYQSIYFFTLRNKAIRYEDEPLSIGAE
ncbi:MAG: hypothetical protein ACK5MN_12025 [Lachnospiraceae bacterium]